MFRRKPLEMILTEADTHPPLRRVLGPVSLISLGIGAIIGAGIFSITGRVASQEAGPAVIVSFIIAGLACSLAALCYAELASMVPIAGSAYTYAYATLGEIIAWIIGWDLVLEYAMSCAVVAAHWTSYFDALLGSLFNVHLPKLIMSDPWTPKDGQYAWINLPAIIIILIITVILVKGIKESAWTNSLLVAIKVSVVLLIVAVGCFYIESDNWFHIAPEYRKYTDINDYLERNIERFLKAAPSLPARAPASMSGRGYLNAYPQITEFLTSEEVTTVSALPSEMQRWGAFAILGWQYRLKRWDEYIRTPFFPYGISGVMMGAALVFFSYIGFDSISTHSEEAITPQRDIPLGIIGSLLICSILYIATSAVLTGITPYHKIDPDAAFAHAFSNVADNTWALKIFSKFISALISLGALTGMTSVLLVTFLSQARIFLAMARDGLLPPGLFAAIHPVYRTPHKSTILTGILMACAAGLLPIRLLEEMVSIGTLLAFVLVSGAVMILRWSAPQAKRGFICPVIYVVAPASMLINFAMMLFLPLDTWLRLMIWLVIGLILYFLYGYRKSRLNLNSCAYTQ